MKKTSSIVVVARSLEMTKKVKNKNINTGKVSVTETEKNTVLPNDTLTLKVFDQDDNVIGGAVYSGKQFASNLTSREKVVNKRGDKVSFYTLPYTRNKTK